MNVRGQRFFDEGEDFQFYTYAKLGGTILNEPGGSGWQIFHAKVTHLLEGRYNVSFEDIRAVFPAALRHRILLNFEAQAENVPADAVVNAVLAGVSDVV